MKVFLSWSGNRSQAIAEVFNGWLPSVLQAVHPYFSPDDLSKGARWASEIAKELEVSRVALLIVTPENQEAPWLLFEAGALSKNLDCSKVCPLLFGGMEPTDIKGPLVQFQAAQFGKNEMKRVLKMINSELGESSLTNEVLESVFEMWWPKLEKQIMEKLAELGEGDGVTKRSDRELIEEVLALTRRAASVGRFRGTEIAPAAIEDLLNGCTELATVAHLYAPSTETTHAVNSITKPLMYIVNRGGLASPEKKLRLRQAFNAILSLIEPSPETEADSGGEILGLGDHEKLIL